MSYTGTPRSSSQRAKTSETQETPREETPRIEENQVNPIQQPQPALAATVDIADTSLSAARQESAADAANEAEPMPKIVKEPNIQHPTEDVIARAHEVAEEVKQTFAPAHMQAGMLIHDPEFAAKNHIANAMAVSAAPAVELPTGKLDDLPDEVKAQMVNFERMQQEQLLLRVLSVEGKLYTVDMIVAELYYNHAKTIIDRGRIQQRLRSLCKQKLVERQTDSKGIFTITETGLKILGL